MSPLGNCAEHEREKSKRSAEGRSCYWLIKQMAVYSIVQADCEEQIQRRNKLIEKLIGLESFYLSSYTLTSHSKASPCEFFFLDHVLQLRCMTGPSTSFLEFQGPR